LTSAAFFYKNCCTKKIFCLGRLDLQFSKIHAILTIS
jgi:hypothetical protein